MEFGGQQHNSGLNHNRETWQGCSRETMELLPVCSITTYLFMFMCVDCKAADVSGILQNILSFIGVSH